GVLSVGVRKLVGQPVVAALVVITGRRVAGPIAEVNLRSIPVAIAVVRPEMDQCYKVASCTIEAISPMNRAEVVHDIARTTVSIDFWPLILLTRGRGRVVPVGIGIDRR